jgi:hypothetical protein
MRILFAFSKRFYKMSLSLQLVMLMSLRSQGSSAPTALPCEFEDSGVASTLHTAGPRYLFDKETGLVLIPRNLPETLIYYALAHTGEVLSFQICGFQLLVDRNSEVPSSARALFEGVAVEKPIRARDIFHYECMVPSYMLKEIDHNLYVCPDAAQPLQSGESVEVSV